MKHRTSFATAAAGLAIGLASVATADIIPIGEFTGLSSEDFEAFPDYNNGGNTDTLAILGGGGLLTSDPANSFQLWVTSPDAAWGLGGYGSAGNIGQRSMGFFNSSTPIEVTLTLALKATRFGFYYVTADDRGSSMTIRAFDTNGVQLGADQTLDSFGSTFVWAGWSSATGIASITFTGNIAPVIDDVQYDFVPAPGSAAVVLGLGVLGLRRRR